MDSGMTQALASAVGGLIVALAAEARARSRARTAEIEREAYRERLRKDVLAPDRRKTTHEAAPADTGTASPVVNHRGQHHDRTDEAEAVPGDPPV